MKKFLVFILFFLLTGCDFYSDIVSIDVSESILIGKVEKYNVFFKILSSNEENEEKIYNQECEKIEICFNNLSNKLSKKLYLSHMNLLVLEDSLENRDYKDIFNFFINQNSSRNFFNIVSVNKINDNLLKQKQEDINNITSLSIKTNGYVDNVTLYDVVNDLLNSNTSFIPHFDTLNEIAITGYKKIIKNERILSKEESISKNIIYGDIKTFALNINDNIYKLEECKEKVKVKYKVFIDVFCSYENSDDNKNMLSNYVKNMLMNYIENVDNSYIKHLVYKYKNKKVNNFEYVISVNIDAKKIKGGDIFE